MRKDYSVTIARLYKIGEMSPQEERNLQQGWGSYGATGRGEGSCGPLWESLSPSPPELRISCHRFSCKPSKTLEKPFLPTTRKL